MAEYIEREALYKKVTEKYHDINAGSYPFNIVAYDMAQLIKNAPTADVVEVKHGEWTKKSTCVYQCSLCEGVALLDFKGEPCKYCPNCGAKMDLKEGAEE